MILADYLVSQRLTVTAFAERIGRPVSTVHSWLSGARQPDIATAAEIERATAGAVASRDWLHAQRRMRDAKAAPDNAPTAPQAA